MDESVVRAAVSWWKAKRPPGFGLIEHLKNPTFGCLTIEERDLARSVAEYERKRMRGLIETVIEHRQD